MTRQLSYFRLALRGVRFYWRTQVCVFVGATIASAVLVGGLLVGDCVNYSLQRLALLRLGDTQVAMQLKGRFVDAGLTARLEEEAAVPVAPALLLRGVVMADSRDGAPIQVNQVQVVGVDSNFWRLASGDAHVLDANTAAVNAKLAMQLGVTEGQEISVRVGRSSVMPNDAPLASRKDAARTRRGTFTVRSVIPDEKLGRFSLEANQVAPHNLFVDLAWLQDVAGIEGRANVLLVGGKGDQASHEETLNAALRKAWRLEDVGLSLTRHGALTQLGSERVFLDPSVSQAALSAGLSLGSDAVGALAYLVNGVRKGERSTPYSFAVAAGQSRDASLGLMSEDIGIDGVIINQWLSDQLDADEGDSLTVDYYALKPGGGFVERRREFVVHRVAAMEVFEHERMLMPEFPGLTDVNRCRDWDVGMPMEEAALNDEANQAYWEAYGPTPKLVIPLEAGREMWGNRFGDLSTVRYRIKPTDEPALRQALRRAIDPAALGLFFVPVREQALQAVDQAMSFGELFISMSCFLIAAALMLTGMLFAFGIQQRAGEMGLLLGVGYQPRQVRHLFLWEGGLLALVGAIAGGLLGMTYTRVLLWGLGRYWHGAIAGAAILYHAKPASVVAGIAGSLLCALLAMSVAMRSQTKRPARELLVGDLGQDHPVKSAAGPCLRTIMTMVVAAAAAVAAAIYGLGEGQEHTVYIFFGSGFLLLVAGLSLSRLILQHCEQGRMWQLSTVVIAMRNASRRGGRSLTTIALLACGCFIVVAVSAMQQDLSAIADQRWSGTGGFSLFGETTLSIPDAQGTAEGRSRFRFASERALADVEIVSLKVRDGDDASCLNLNRAQAPRLIGLDAEAFQSRGAFMPKGAGQDDPWSLLDCRLPDGVIPGLVGDGNTAMWNLQKKTGPDKGDELIYRDERGSRFRVKLVGTLPMPLSVFQGSVLISRADFEEKYPSEDGFRMFLVDVPGGADPAPVQQALSRRLERVGLDMTSTLNRLEAFHEVEATYLNMFLVLGGLGVVLGTIGLGIVVLRNALERRSEFALLRCVGFPRAKVAWVVLAEHVLLLVLGLSMGGGSALVAIAPGLAAPGTHVPVGTILALMLGIALVGVVSVLVAARTALRGALIPALRKE